MFQVDAEETEEEQREKARRAASKKPHLGTAAAGHQSRCRQAVAMASLTKVDKSAKVEKKDAGKKK